jgi:hypothetical protein
MRIIITVGEIMSLDAWEDYCKLTDTAVYAVKKGLLSYHSEVDLTEKQARELKLI